MFMPSKTRRMVRHQPCVAFVVLLVGTVLLSCTATSLTSLERLTTSAAAPALAAGHGTTSEQLRKTAASGRVDLGGRASSRSLLQDSSPKSGKVEGWGENIDFSSSLAGQITIPAAASSNVISVAAGEAHSVALLDSGQVLAWGSNINGQTAVPASLGNVVAIAAGGNFSLALLDSGMVAAWGEKSYGQTSVPTKLINVQGIAAGCDTALAVLGDGTVVAWGRDDRNLIAGANGLSNVEEISAGCDHALARLKDGTVVGIGSNSVNQTLVPAGLSGVVGIAAGGYHSLALLGNGTVVGWGRNDQGQATVPAGLSGLQAIAAGRFHSLALFGNGSVKAWGWMTQTSVPPRIYDIIRIAGGGRHSLSIQQLQANPVIKPPQGISPGTMPPPDSTLPAPSTPPVVNQGSSGSSGSSAGVIGGAVGGVLGGVAVVGLLAAWQLKKRRASKDVALAKSLSSSRPRPGEGLLLAIPPDTSPRPSGTWQSSDVGMGVPRDPAVTHTPHNTQTNGSRGSSIYSAAASPHVMGVIRARTLRNMGIAWDDLKIDENTVLGRGGFGSVLKGVWQGSIPVAVKILNSMKLDTDSLEALRSEALIMRDMHHPCIAPVYGIVDDGIHHAMVMRLYKRGSVAAAISQPTYCLLSDTQRLRMALQVATGMRSLHEHRPAPVIHGDLKASNLLVDDDGKSVVIADFGLACCLREGELGQAIESGALTVSISPPEVLQNPKAPRTTAGDVYAFGVTLMEVVIGRAAFRGMHARDLARAVMTGGRPAIPDDVPADVASLITACWAQDAAARPTFAEIVARLNAVLANGNLNTTRARADAQSGLTITTLADVTSFL